MRFTNPTSGTIAVRDDAGKHLVGPGEAVDITGDQHAPVWLEAGLVEAQAEVADPDDAPRARQGGKRSADDPGAVAPGEADGRPDQAAG